MSKELQKKYMEYVLEQRRSTHAIEARYALMEIEAKLDAGAITPGQAERDRKRVAQRDPAHVRLPDINDPQYWQKLPLNSAERAGFKPWVRSQLTGEDLTPETRRKLLKEAVGRPVEGPEDLDRLKVFALALLRPELVSNEQLLKELAA